LTETAPPKNDKNVTEPAFALPQKVVAPSPIEKSVSADSKARPDDYDTEQNEKLIAQQKASDPDLTINEIE
jgi:hypothetical protein